MLVDEYQDTNRVQYQLVQLLASAHRNICVVGDPDQCLPPSTVIETPSGPAPIRDLEAGERVSAAAGHGRQHSGVVEKVATRHYRGSLTRITTESGRVLDATPNHLCFGRLDPVEGMHYVYLMHRADMGFRIGTTSGVRSSKDGARINGVMVRTNQEVADAVWILKATRDRAEASYLEQRYSVRYGLPTAVFHSRGRKVATTRSWLDRLYSGLDTRLGADLLMEDLCLDPRYPHHRPYAVVRGGLQRRFVWFTMFGDSRVYKVQPWHDHRVQLVTSGEDLRERAQERFSVRNGSKGTWRIETSRKHYDDAHDLASEIASLDALEVVARARLTQGKPFHFMPASHLREGMAIPVLEEGQVVEDRVASVESVDYDGEVYDLSVEELRNYSAGGVVVHNSIYAWRGADIRNILDFENDYPDAKVVTLERNYRSTQPILDGASGVVANNVSRRRKELFTEREGGDKIKVFQAHDDREEAAYVVRDIMNHARDQGRAFGECAIFYRTNAQSRVFEEELLKYDVPYVVVGGVRFYDRAEVKDALAYLRLIFNPSDVAALRRIVNKPARGIGKTTLEKALRAARLRTRPPPGARWPRRSSRKPTPADARPTKVRRLPPT